MYWKRRQIPPHMRVHFTTPDMIQRMATDVGFGVREMDKQRFLIVALQKEPSIDPL